MQIGVIGTCEKSCPLYLREKITSAFDELVKKDSVKFSYVLLSTCRRVELYFYSEDLTGAHVEILQKLRRVLKVPFEHVLFSLFESESFSHLIKVTAGLDSSITGESEIQKQVKISYGKACSNRPLPNVLHFAFQKSLKAGKQMRSSFELFKRQNSLAHVILTQLGLLSQKSFREQNILFIGNSQINRLILPVFFAKGFQKITLCSQSSKNELFEEQPNFHFDSYDVINHIQSFDAVICATKASKYLIRKDHNVRASQVLFDLSIPRNIDPKVKNLAPLLNIEELGSLFEEKKNSLRKEISECETIVSNLVEKYQKIYYEKQEKKRLYLSSSLQKAAV